MPKMLAAVGSIVALALVAAVPAGAAAPSRTPHVQKVAITIRGGDRVTEPNVALAPGVPVRITVTNYTHEFHTFTIPGLGLSKLILPARGHAPRTTTFSFTTYRWGSFAWNCVLCPSGEHGRAHGMGGTIYLIVDPSVAP